MATEQRYVLDLTYRELQAVLDGMHEESERTRHLALRAEYEGVALDAYTVAHRQAVNTIADRAASMLSEISHGLSSPTSRNSERDVRV